jgi:hypothetical protein
MKGYGGKLREDIPVLSIRQKSCAWSVVEVIAMYASVDTITVLPLLILTNVICTWNMLCVIGAFPS